RGAAGGRVSPRGPGRVHSLHDCGGCLLFHHGADHPGYDGRGPVFACSPGDPSQGGRGLCVPCLVRAGAASTPGPPRSRRAKLNPRNKFLIILGAVFAAALTYYLLSTPRGSDLILIGSVDANQVIVSPQTPGRISKLLVDEGTQVKQGDLIATLDPSELEAQARAAAAMIDSLRSQVSATQATSVATRGSTASSVANAQARLESARAQLLEAEATLQRVESDSRRTIQLAAQGVASDQDRVQAESNLKAQQAVVASWQQQVSATQADLSTAIANTHQAHAAESTVASTRGQLLNAEAQLKQAEVRLGYTKIYAPVTGTVSVRAAREGEFLNPGQPV